ncbi:MAG: terminase family protein [Pseudomonadota bacterium]
MRSGANLIASGGPDRIERFLDSLAEDEGELLSLPYLFEFWALEHQLPPEGDWHCWMVMGGRGAGKTRAGSEWVRAQVEGALPLDPGVARRVALIGETVEQVRDVMIFGESGILACSPPDRRPEWLASKKRLLWHNGATAQIYSAQEPEALRGPQFDCAWVDELAKFKKAQDTWDMLQFALRLGEHPQICVTTTPRNTALIKQLLARESTVVTHAPTEANKANLAQSFLEEVRVRYAGTRLGRQELDGILVDHAEGALWTGEILEAARVDDVPDLDRIVVALDPPVTGKSTSDECGIIVAGAQTKGPVQNWRAYVLADCSVHAARPAGWAAKAIAAMEQYGADRLVAEVNQGGDMVTEVMRQIDPMVPVKAVHATRGKAARAEPVAALYEQGRVFHARHLETLEDQMCAMTARGYEASGSPDRLDAMVWALTELMIEPAAKWRRPRMRAVE